jgi:hypothetical protein
MADIHLFLKDTDGKGRGVFTTNTIPADTVLEVSPVIVMTQDDRKLIDQTLLHDYIFEWQPDGLQMCCMALGWVPMYNHSYESNCEYFMDYDEQNISIQSIRNIEAGEELTINYNGDWNNAGKVWFDVN